MTLTVACQQSRQISTINLFRKDLQQKKTSADSWIQLHAKKLFKATIRAASQTAPLPKANSGDSIFPKKSKGKL